MATKKQKHAKVLAEEKELLEKERANQAAREKRFQAAAEINARHRRIIEAAE
jgi:hypothetical protein